MIKRTVLSIFCLLFVGTALYSSVPGVRVVNTINLTKDATLDHPIPIGVDLSNGCVFVGGYYSGNVIKYNPATKEVKGEIKGINYAQHVIISDCIPTKLYVSGLNDSWECGIFVYNSSDLTQICRIPSLNGWIQSLVIDSENQIAYYGTCGRVYKVNLNDNTQELMYDFGTWSYIVSDIDLDKERNKLYITIYHYYTADAEIAVYDLTKRQIGVNIDIGKNPAGFDHRYDSAQDGKYLFTTQMYSSSITVVNVETNKVDAIIPDVSWPQKLAVDKSKHRLYVVDNYTDKFHVIDTVKFNLIKTFCPGDDPSGVCVDSVRNRVYTANVWTQDIGIVDSLSETLIERVSFAPATPLGIVIQSADKKAYVTNGPNSGIFVIDTQSNELVDKIVPYSTFRYFGDLYVSAGIMNVYTGETVILNGKLFVTDDYNHKLAVFDLATKDFIKHIDGTATGVAEDGSKVYFPYVDGTQSYLGITDGNNTESILLGVSEKLAGVAVNKNKVYVADSSNNEVIVVNLANKSVIKKIAVGYYPVGIAINSKTNVINVTNYGSDSISVIDGDTDELLGYIPVGNGPWGIAVNDSTNRIYVVDSGEDTISVINGYTSAVKTTLPVGRGAKYCALVDDRFIYVPNQLDGTITVLEDIVDTTLPVIKHTPVAGPIVEGNNVSISCEIADASALVETSLYYRSGNSDEYKKVSLTVGEGGSYTTIIPAEDVSASKLEYYISAVDDCNNSAQTEVYKITVESSVLPGSAKAWITIPRDGKKVSGNAVTVKADATKNTTGVQFQYRQVKIEVNGEWINISDIDRKSPFSIYWNVSALPNGEYNLRAVAYDGSPLPEPTPLYITVFIDDVNADIIEDGNPEVDPNKSHRVEQKIDTNNDNTIELADGTKVEIPANAVNNNSNNNGNDTVKLIVESNVQDVPEPVDKSGLKSVGVFSKFEFSSGKRAFSKLITISLPYPDENKDGIVDGTDIKADDLRMMYFNEQLNEWTEIENEGKVSMATNSGNSNLITTKTSHFTLFGLFYYEGKTNLDNVIVYPNPFKQYQGHNKITFDGLTSGKTKIKIYTIAGRLVQELEREDGIKIDWSLDNEDISSGVYLYYISDDKGNKTLGKLAIIK